MRRDTHNIFLSERTSVNTHRKRAPSQLSRSLKRKERRRLERDAQLDGERPEPGNARRVAFMVALVSVAGAIVALALLFRASTGAAKR